jgi:hypothetical protein
LNLERLLHGGAPSQRGCPVSRRRLLQLTSK